MTDHDTTLVPENGPAAATELEPVSEDRRVTVSRAGDGSWSWGLFTADPLSHPGAASRLIGNDGFADQAAATEDARAVLHRNRDAEISGSEPPVAPEPAQAELAGVRHPVNLGETIFGVTVWAVLPRMRGQQTGLQHLTWNGPGHPVRLHAGGVSDGRMEHYGVSLGTVSSPCHTEDQAHQAACAYLTGPALQPAAARSADPPQPRTAAEASGAAGVLATDLEDDETARALADHGTPEQRLEYALTKFSRWRRDAFEAAAAQLDADGEPRTAAARQRHDVAYTAANGRWAAETAAAATRYAREIGAGRPASSGPGDVTLPYTLGSVHGYRMHADGFPRRRAGYDDTQWGEYVAGYADGAGSQARETVKFAEAVREQAADRRDPACRGSRDNIAAAPVRPPRSRPRRTLLALRQPPAERAGQPACSPRGRFCLPPEGGASDTAAAPG